MKRMDHDRVSARERQVLDILFRRGRATAEEVMGDLPDPPGYSAVRALMATLESKGLVRHSKESRRYVYEPAIAPEKARDSALKKLVRTFFDGSPGKLVATLLDKKESKLQPDEIAAIRKLLDEQSPP